MIHKSCHQSTTPRSKPYKKCYLESSAGMSLGFCMAAIFAFSSSESSVALFVRVEEPVRSEELSALDIGWWLIGTSILGKWVILYMIHPHHPKMFDQITSKSNGRRSGVERSKLLIVEDLSQSLSWYVLCIRASKIKKMKQLSVEFISQELKRIFGIMFVTVDILPNITSPDWVQVWS